MIFAREDVMKKLTHHEFSIGLPEGWQDMTEVFLQGPASEEGLAPSIIVLKEELETEQNVEDFAYEQLEGLMEAIEAKGIEAFDEGIIKIAGQDAFQRIYNFPFSEATFTQMQVYVIRRSIAYIIIFTTDKKRFSKDLPIFKKILGNFKFENQMQ